MTSPPLPSSRTTPLPAGAVWRPPVWRPWPPPVASVQDRALAYLIDASLLSMVTFVVVIVTQQVFGLMLSFGFGVIGATASGTAAGEAAFALVFFAVVVAVLNLTVLLSLLASAAWFWFVPARMQGQTVGKRLLGLRAIRRDLRSATTWTHARRWLALHVDGALYGLVGLALLLTSSPPRRLGDRWADTVVVKG